MENQSLLSELFDEKLLKVISILMTNRNKKFYLQEIADQTKVPIASTYRILQKLSRLGLVDLVPVSRFKLYRIADNEKTKQLETLLIGRKTPLETFIEMIKDTSGIEEIVLHGEESREGADIVIIGAGIDQEPIKLACAKIKEDYNFPVKQLTLDRIQFEQMKTMNLFPKRKKILYKNY